MSTPTITIGPRTFQLVDSELSNIYDAIQQLDAPERAHKWQELMEALAPPHSAERAELLLAFTTVFENETSEREFIRLVTVTLIDAHARTAQCPVERARWHAIRRAVPNNTLSELGILLQVLAPSWAMLDPEHRVMQRADTLTPGTLCIHDREAFEIVSKTDAPNGQAQFHVRYLAPHIGAATRHGALHFAADDEVETIRLPDFIS